MSVPSVEARLRRPPSRVCIATLCTPRAFSNLTRFGGRVSGKTGTALCSSLGKKKTGAIVGVPVSVCHRFS
jgi:hypothetical protein